MTQEEVLAEFRQSGALLEGHFKLSSGRHSGHYLQCARVLMNPARAARLAEAVVAGIPSEVREQVHVVVSPAMGGIIIGHEVGRALGKDALFLERPEGVFHLRRGFALAKGAKVLMVEDVVTTGLSSREAIAAVAREGGEVIAECAIIDRSCGSVDLGVPFYPLLAIDFPTYDGSDIPASLAAVEVTKPGSRKE
ncbi:orotate phosphoribosyltransferase [Porphyrobacter sp. YT40]|uniref:orotate phosphoribosyltransferase n=1 Tax=Porphyrobacter sp. YT40 TaxID=2547601 RepID=UPI001141D0B1|nr:orotate phosphoribosyltransferase [Porphyrobacter sp. YT40]QDH35421.1 orotate phosphoribosyltransferase [Porphyrobacter sp. YT40]